MLGKLRQAGSGVKKGVGELKSHTEIEAEYLLAKSKGFDYPPELVEHIEIMNDIHTVYEELNVHVGTWIAKYQEVIDFETNAAEKLKAVVLVKQVEVINKAKNQFADHQMRVQQLQQHKLGSILELVHMPIKKFLSDQQNLKRKLELTNKAWVELRYWKKRSSSQQQQESQQMYNTNAKSLMDSIKSLQEFAEKDFPQKVELFQKAQLEFAQNLSRVCGAEDPSSDNEDMQNDM